MKKELDLLALFYQENELKISDISKKLKVSKNMAKKLVDSLVKNYFVNILYDKKKRAYFLAQKLIESESLNIKFWEELLMFILYSFSKTDNEKLRNLSILLLFNFYKFYDFYNQNSEDKKVFFESDFLFFLNENFLFYVKEMDYTLFIKIKSAIVNKNEIRVSFYDRIDLMVKRVNVYPLYLSFLRKDWFLIAYSPNDQNYVVINVNDIKDVGLTGRSFEEDFSGFVEDALPELKEYIIPSKKWTILLDIDEYVKVYGIGFLHPSQKIFKENGKVFLQLEIANLPIFFRWLSSYGKLIKIVEPEVVKQKYIKYLLSIADWYNN